MFHLTAGSCPIGEPTFGWQAGKTSSAFRYIYFFNALARSCRLHRWGSRDHFSRWKSDRDESWERCSSYVFTGISEVASQNPIGSQVDFKVAWSGGTCQRFNIQLFRADDMRFSAIPRREQDKERLSMPVSDHTVCHPFVVTAIIKYQKVLAPFHR